LKSAAEPPRFQKHPVYKMLLIFAAKIIPLFVRDVNNLQKTSPACGLFS